MSSFFTSAKPKIRLRAKGANCCVRIVCWALLGAVALLCVPSLRGAEKESQLDLLVARCAFGPLIVNQAWLPVQARIRNSSGRERRAGVAVDVSLAGESRHRVRYTTTARIPPNSIRTVNLAMVYDVPQEAFLELLKKKKRTLALAGGRKRTVMAYDRRNLAVQVQLIDRETGAKTDEAPLLAMPVHPDEVFAVATDEEASTFTTEEQYTLDGCEYVLGEYPEDVQAFRGERRYPQSTAISSRNVPGIERAPAGVRLARVRATDLPPRWALYEGVNTLFLGSLSRDGAPPAGLNPQQRRSLLRWVRSGGRLVITPVHSPEVYRHPFWRQLLPVRVTGTRLLGAEREALARRFGTEYVSESEMPAMIAEALPGTGEMLLTSQGQVLLARRKVGGGEVWFSAIPGEAMKSWSGGPEYWAAMFAPRPNPVPGLKSALSADAPEILGRLAGAAAPKRGVIVKLIFAYVILAISVLFLTRLAGRPELGWPALLGLSVVCALLAMAAGLAVHKDVGFVTGEAGVTVLGEGESHASVTSFVGMHSPRERTTDILWPNPDTLATAQPAGSAGGGALSQAVAVHQDAHFTFPSVKLQPGNLQLSRAMTLVQYDEGIEVTAGVGPNGLEGQVTNRTGDTLTDCLLRLNRRTYRIGRIEDGATVNLANAEPSWDLRAKPYAVGAGEEDQLRQWILADCLHGRRQSLRGGGSEIVYTWPVALYGWTRSPQAVPVPVGVEKQPRHRALQLLTVPVSRPNLRAGDVMVPEGACGIRTLNSSARLLFESRRASAQGRGRYVRTSGMKRIAGMDRRASRGVRVSSQGRAHLAMQDRVRPPGWAEGQGTASGEVQFVRPDWLTSLRLERIDVIADFRLNDVNAEIAVRRPGEDAYQSILGSELGQDRVIHTIRDVASVLGPDGELPEFRIRIGLGQDFDARATASWQIREFDLRLHGTAPVAADKTAQTE